MSRIRSSDTKPEIILRKALHRKGFRYQVYPSNLPGKPDIVLKRHGFVIFVHGCFWHGHKDCKRANLPKSNRDYWANKIHNNISRDRRNSAHLRSQGWHVLTVWECDITNKLDSTLTKIIKRIRSSK